MITWLKLRTRHEVATTFLILVVFVQTIALIDLYEVKDRQEKMNENFYRTDYTQKKINDLQAEFNFEILDYLNLVLGD